MNESLQRTGWTYLLFTQSKAHKGEKANSDPNGIFRGRKRYRNDPKTVLMRNLLDRHGKLWENNETFKWRKGDNFVFSLEYKLTFVSELGRIRIFCICYRNWVKINGLMIDSASVSGFWMASIICKFNERNVIF